MLAHAKGKPVNILAHGHGQSGDTDIELVGASTLASALGRVVFSV